MPLYVVQNVMYEYYKYGTEPNATVVGSPTNENGVISGFTTANYLKFPQEFKPESKTWEMLWKVTTGSSFTVKSDWAAGIFGEPTNNSYGVWLDINASGHLRLHVGTGSGRQTFTSTITLAKVTTYYIKAYYTGTQYFVDYSTDNVTFENIIITDYATPMAFISGNVQIIGQSHYGGAIGGSGYSGAWLGSIDLNECHIKIDGKMWWNGTKGVLSTKDDYDYKVLKAKNYTVQNTRYKYYKEIYTDWEQPSSVSYSNPLGGDVFTVGQLGWSNYPITNSFNASGGDSIIAASPARVVMYNPKPLKVSKIRVQNRGYDGVNNWYSKGTLQYSDDGSTWIDVQTFSGAQGNSAWYPDIIPQEQGAHKYWGLYMTGRYGDAGFNKIELTAQEYEITEGTGDEHTYKVVKRQNKLVKGR